MLSLFKFYLSACDVPDPHPKLFGDEFDEQKLSIDTQSLPVFDFFIVGGLGEAHSSKLISSRSLKCDLLGCCCCCCACWWWCLVVKLDGGAGIFGGSRCSELVCDGFSLLLMLFFEAPKRFERILMDFWLPVFFKGADVRTFGGGGLGGAGFLFANLFTVDDDDALYWFATLIWLPAAWLLFGGGGAGRVGMVIVNSYSFLQANQGN